MNQLSKAQLSEYNFIVAIDRSGSMDGPNWTMAQEIALAVANFAGQVDSNGIDVVTFGATIDAYENTTADAVSEVFRTQSPNGSTPLNEALVKALQIKNKSNKKGFITVVTDGAPDNEASVAKTLTDASNAIAQDNDLTVLFIQVGNDVGATKFLTSLDDNLKGKFDIVDRKTYEEFKTLSFEELFSAAQNG